MSGILIVAAAVTLQIGGWTFDGAPVTVPHCWNAVDGADGLGVPLAPGTNVIEIAAGRLTRRCTSRARAEFSRIENIKDQITEETRR